ncbi:MAG: hypothetical protein HY939_04195 [Gammaproteobacteria bacterium]|nr:hypothetical protein [Gammaproteobacteria bacterium]
MWKGLRALGHKVIGWARDWGRKTREVMLAIPRSFEIIKNNPEVRSSLGHVLAANVRFFLSVTLIRYIKTQFVRLTAEKWGYSQNTAEMVDQTLESTVFLVWVMRSRLRLGVVNTLASLGAAHQIAKTMRDRPAQTDEDDFVCVPPQPCGKHDWREGAVGGLNLCIHFVLGNLAVTGCTVVVGVVDEEIAWYVGVLLRGYFQGVIAYEYALDQQDICAGHQVAILTQDPMRCFALGMFLQLVSSGNALVVKNTEWQMLFDNVLGALSVLHANVLSFPIPDKLPDADQINKWDPVVLSWLGSTACLERLSQKMNEALKAYLNGPTDLSREINFVRRYVQHTPAVSWGLRVLLPRELRSLEALAKHPDVAPYSRPFCGFLDGTLQTIKEIREKSVVRAAQAASGYVPGMNWGVKKIVSTHFKLPPSLVELLYRVAADPALPDKLSTLQQTLRDSEPLPSGGWNLTERFRFFRAPHFQRLPSPSPSIAASLSPS